MGAQMALLLATLGLGMVASLDLKVLDNYSKAPKTSEKQNDNVELTIVHWNDVHGRALPQSSYGSDCVGGATTDCVGGWGKLGGIKNFYCAEDPECIVLDAGDQYTGTLYSSVYRGTEAAKLLNLIGVDAFVLGNHEFDHGTKALNDNFLANTKFPVLAANVDFSNDPNVEANATQPYVVLERKGLKIGIIGITTTDTTFSSSPGPNVEFLDEPAAIQKAANALRWQNVHVVIALTHQGYLEDIAAAKQVHGVDLYIGGHSHTLLLPKDDPHYSKAAGPYPTAVVDKAGKTVHVVQAQCYTFYAGVLKLTYDPQSHKLVSITPAHPYYLTNNPAAGTPPYFKDDSAVTTLQKQLSEGVMDFSSTNIGETLVDLPNDNSRSGESLIGELVAESMIHALHATTKVHVDCALQNGGGVRISIPAGNINAGQAYTLLPFSNVITVLPVTGAQIIQALENGVARVDHGSGRFPQVANMRFSFCRERPPGSRVIAAYVVRDGKDINLFGSGANQTFHLATNDFVARGGDHYTVLSAIEPVLESGLELAQAFSDYVSDISPIQKKLSNRITETCGCIEWNSAKHVVSKAVSWLLDYVGQR